MPRHRMTVLAREPIPVPVMVAVVAPLVATASLLVALLAACGTEAEAEPARPAICFASGPGPCVPAETLPPPAPAADEAAILRASSASDGASAGAWVGEAP